MATSLYGTVKKINQSCFVFDKIYNTRADMEANKDTDGVYHSRYVLVTYGEKYSNVSASNPVTNDDGDIESYLDQNPNVLHDAPLNPQQSWINHYNTDIGAYGNQYDNTVWQKIYEGSSVKYIMVASLNARAPSLTINEDYYSFSLPADNNGEIYYTKELGSNDVSTSMCKATYPIPQWHETISNDLIYHLDMPMPVKVNLGSFDYFSQGLNPRIHYKITTYSNDNDNYIRWEHILKPNTNNVVGADFNFNIPRIGEAISDIYDALYGVPYENEEEQDNAQRPFMAQQGFTNLKDETQQALSQTGYKGLLYILDHIGLRASDGHYLIGSDWDANSSSFGHIDNKPKKITNISVASFGLWTFTVVDNT